MALSGHDLAADLSDLRFIATANLPSLAHIYATLNNDLAATAAHDVAVFSQPGGGGMDQVYADRAERWAAGHGRGSRAARPSAPSGAGVSFAYRSPQELRRLGERVRDKAIAVTLNQSDSYGQAQQHANNDASRVASENEPRAAGYQPPATGRPDDHDNLKVYLQAVYGQIPDLYAAFAIPNPDQYHAMVEQLYRIAISLEPSRHHRPQRRRSPDSR